MGGTTDNYSSDPKATTFGLTTSDGTREAQAATTVTIDRSDNEHSAGSLLRSLDKVESRKLEGGVLAS